MPGDDNQQASSSSPSLSLQYQGFEDSIPEELVLEIFKYCLTGEAREVMTTLASISLVNQRWHRISKDPWLAEQKNKVKNEPLVIMASSIIKTVRNIIGAERLGDTRKLLLDLMQKLEIIDARTSKLSRAEDFGARSQYAADYSLLSLLEGLVDDADLQEIRSVYDKALLGNAAAIQKFAYIDISFMRMLERVSLDVLVSTKQKALAEAATAEASSQQQAGSDAAASKLREHEAGAGNDPDEELGWDDSDFDSDSDDTSSRDYSFYDSESEIDLDSDSESDSDSDDLVFSLDDDYQSRQRKMRLREPELRQQHHASIIGGAINGPMPLSVLQIDANLPFGIPAVVELLQTENNPLRMLTITANRRRFDNVEVAIPFVLAAGLDHPNNQLQVLNIQAQEWDLQPFSDGLCNYIRNDTNQLQHLSFQRVYSAGIALLMQQLTDALCNPNNKLKSLAFNHCRISGGYESILTALNQEHCKLEKLVINNTHTSRISNEGVEQLCLAIRNNLTLKTLELGFINDAGGGFVYSDLLRIAEALRSPESGIDNFIIHSHSSTMNPVPIELLLPLAFAVLKADCQGRVLKIDGDINFASPVAGCDNLNELIDALRRDKVGTLCNMLEQPQIMALILAADDLTEEEQAQIKTQFNFLGDEDNSDCLAGIPIIDLHNAHNTPRRNTDQNTESQAKVSELNNDVSNYDYNYKHSLIGEYNAHALLEILASYDGENKRIQACYINAAERLMAKAAAQIESVLGKKDSKKFLSLLERIILTSERGRLKNLRREHRGKFGTASDIETYYNELGNKIVALSTFDAIIKQLAQQLNKIDYTKLSYEQFVTHFEALATYYNNKNSAPMDSIMSEILQRKSVELFKTFVADKVPYQYLTKALSGLEKPSRYTLEAKKEVINAERFVRRIATVVSAPGIIFDSRYMNEFEEQVRELYSSSHSREWVTEELNSLLKGVKGFVSSNLEGAKKEGKKEKLRECFMGAFDVIIDTNSKKTKCEKNLRGEAPNRQAILKVYPDAEGFDSDKLLEQLHTIMLLYLKFTHTDWSNQDKLTLIQIEQKEHKKRHPDSYRYSRLGTGGFFGKLASFVVHGSDPDAFRFDDEIARLYKSMESYLVSLKNKPLEIEALELPDVSALLGEVLTTEGLLASLNAEEAARERDTAEAGPSSGKGKQEVEELEDNKELAAADELVHQHGPASAQAQQAEQEAKSATSSSRKGKEEDDDTYHDPSRPNSP